MDQSLLDVSNDRIAATILSKAISEGLLSREWVAQVSNSLESGEGLGLVGGEKRLPASDEQNEGGASRSGGIKRIKRPLSAGNCSDPQKMTTNMKEKKEKKKPKAFDLSTKLQRHVAFRLAYDGEAYQGFSQNVGTPGDESVERYLFEALVKCRLIEKRQTCCYSRCGRTDKGVSAFGQIIALKVRSAFPLSTPLSDLPSNPNDSIPVTTTKVNKKTGEEETKTTMVKECDYIKMLNGCLPPELRVISWVPVTEEFSARFSCMSRTYRYFFPRRNLDLAAMRAGLAKIVGDHDFRNMAKMDTEHVSNFRRVIYSAEIIETMGGSGGSREGCYFQIKGQAFLWHMVRNIVQVMFFIGEGKEEPSVVDELFDVEKLPGKPNYQMASDLPLVLHRCDFNNLDMLSSASNLWDVQCHLEKRWNRFKIKSLQIENGIDSIASECTVDSSEVQAWARNKFDVGDELVVGGGKISWGEALSALEKAGIRPGPHHKPPDHTKLMERGKGLTYEEKVGQMQGKKKERYEAAMAKRKGEGVDKEFYRWKQEQGGSGMGGGRKGGE